MATTISYGMPPDLNITASCITYDQYVAILSQVVLFEDAKNAAIMCFIAGMLTMHIFQWIERKWR